MKISEWLALHPFPPITVKSHSSLNEAVDRLLEEPCFRDIYVISETGMLLGHLSHRRLIQFFLAEHRQVHTRRQIIERVAVGPAEEFMDHHYVSAHPEEELDNVLHRQLQHDLVDLPIIDEEGKLVGVLNMNMVLREMRREVGESTKVSR
jgi:Mg/Co/Ni transporter MgtE